jgi:D-alanyl-D-alanine carboxypeptidase
MVEALAKSMRMPQSQTSERHEKMRNLLDYTFNEQHETMRGKSKIKAIDGRESADESVSETMVKEESDSAENEESQRQERIDRENQAIKVVARKVFLRDPLAPDAASLLARIEYIEFLRAKTDNAIQTCRLTMAVTAYIYFLTQLLRERGKEGKK